MYESFSLIFAIAALLSFANYKWLKLPATIGQVILALLIAVTVMAMEHVLPDTYQFFCDIVLNTDFSHVLLDVLLGFLLFAGALHVNIQDLKKERISVFLFATIGVLISTILVGTGVYYLSNFLTIGIPYLHCLLFGALISPTDPIAVLSLLKNTKVSKSLQLKIEGESLFNDGIGVIVFTAILLFAGMDSTMEYAEGSFTAEIFKLFFEEVVVGIVLGLVMGFIGYRLMKSAQDNPPLTVILSLAVVFGGYALASILHSSGPLAMVVAGLYIGNSICEKTFRSETRKDLDDFWHILDESLNGVVFVFLGLAVHLVTFKNLSYVILMLLSILLVLLCRYVSVLLPYSLLKHAEGSWLKTVNLLTWGGLKGGISLALAFSLMPEYSREDILLLTYGTVIFSILVQGLTIPTLIKKLYE